MRDNNLTIAVSMANIGTIVDISSHKALKLNRFPVIARGPGSQPPSFSRAASVNEQRWASSPNKSLTQQ